MLCNIPEKFDKYVAGRRVSKDIPDEMLEELKKINERMKKKGHSEKDYFDFPR